MIRITVIVHTPGNRCQKQFDVTRKMPDGRMAVPMKKMI